MTRWKSRKLHSNQATQLKIVTVVWADVFSSISYLHPWRRALCCRAHHKLAGWMGFQQTGCLWWMPCHPLTWSNYQLAKPWPDFEGRGFDTLILCPLRWDAFAEHPCHAQTPSTRHSTRPIKSGPVHHVRFPAKGYIIESFQPLSNKPRKWSFGSANGYHNPAHDLVL